MPTSRFLNLSDKLLGQGAVGLELNLLLNPQIITENDLSYTRDVSLWAR